MDDDESVRYLASYLEAHSQDLIITEFDRTASHSCGEYIESYRLNREALELKIKEFYANLL